MSHRRTLHHRLLSIVALSAVALSACSGGGSSSASEDTTTTSAGSDACALLASAPDAGGALDDAAAAAEADVAAAIDGLQVALAADDRGGAEAAAADLAEACDEPSLAEAAGAWHLAEAEATPTYTCTGADPASSSLLQVFGADVTFAPRLTLAAVDPAPGEGDTFEASFTGALALTGDLVDGVIALGITSATVREMAVTITALEGVEGDDVVGNPPPAEFELVSGEPVELTVGPYTGTFTRTAAAGAVSFAPGTLALTLSATFNGAPVDLGLTCEPEAGAAISTTDTRA